MALPHLTKLLHDPAVDVMRSAQDSIDKIKAATV